MTLISPGRDFGFDTALLQLGTVATFGTLTYLTIKTAVSAPRYFLDMATATIVATSAMQKMTDKSGILPGYNFIYISDYNKVQNKCAVELGVDAK